MSKYRIAEKGKRIWIEREYFVGIWNRNKVWHPVNSHGRTGGIGHSTLIKYYETLDEAKNKKAEFETQIIYHY